jgi:hypothetical protein
MSIIGSTDLTARLPFLAVVRKDMLQRLRGGRLFFWMGLSVALAGDIRGSFILASPTIGFYRNLNLPRNSHYFTSYWAANIAACTTWSSVLLWYSMWRLKRIWARGIE